MIRAFEASGTWGFRSFEETLNPKTLSFMFWGLGLWVFGDQISGSCRVQNLCFFGLGF